MDPLTRYRTHLKKMASDPRARRERLISQFGRDLLSLMRKRKETVSTVALKLGKSRQWVSRALGGSENLTLETMWRLAEAIDANVVVTVEDRRVPKPAWSFLPIAPSQQPSDWPTAAPVRGQATCAVSIDQAVEQGVV